MEDLVAPDAGGPGLEPSVLAAMRKWPNVPDCFGWLELDGRGRWRIGGEPLTHPALIAFIERNYGSDPGGRWFFQNGPQRVFVALEYTPWVLRLDEAGHLRAHTGRPFSDPTGLWLDDDGRLLASAAEGIGLIHDADLPAAVALLADRHGRPASLEALLDPATAPLTIGLRLADGWLPVAPIRRDEVAARFGFAPSPQPRP